jgi:glycosyltransferase involved in cell wall biosynthesis
MNILVFSAYPPMPGGGGKATFEIFKRLSSKNPTFIVTYQKNVDVLNNVHVYHLCLSMKTSFVRGAMYILMSSIVGILLGVIKKVDVIYSKNLVSAGISGYIVSKVLRKSYIIHTSGTDIQNPSLYADSHTIFGRYYSRIVRLFTDIEFNHAHQIIANCREDAKKVGEFGFEEKTVIIYNGVDSLRFQPNIQKLEKIRKELKINKRDFVVCYCGSAPSIKNLGVLLQLARKIANCKFLFIGPTTQDLEKFGKIPSNCICTGHVNNVENYLQAADIFMTPTLGEGVSNALLEAMSCGLPPISYPAGDAILIIKNYENGFIVDNIEDVSKLILELYNNPDLRKKMGINARETIVNNFNWDKTAREIDNVFQLVIE